MDDRNHTDGREEGWLRLWRKLRDSRVFSHPDPWLLKIWVWCLLEAGWKPCWKRGCETPIGAFVTDYSQAATQLNTSRSKVYRTLQTLAEWGQIRLEVKRRFTVVTVCNWGTYQAEEVSERNASETQVKRKRNATETTSLVEEGKNGRTEEAPLPPAGEAVRPEEFLCAWNAIPGFVHAKKWTAKRLRAFRARARDPDWAANWRAALEKASRLPFCLGRGESGWRATADWFLRPDTVTKILEGFYDHLGNGRPSTAQRMAENLGDFISEGNLFDEPRRVCPDRCLPFLGGESGDAEGPG